MIKKVIISLVVFSLTSCSFSGSIPETNQKNTSSTSNSGNKEQDKLKNVPVSKVQITSGDNIVIKEGDKIEVNSSVIYEDNSRDSATSWASSDNTIASINSTNGALSGVKAGVTTITAISLKDSSKKGSATVTVKKAEVVEAITKIDPKEATLKVGETVRLNAQIQMSDGTISPNIEWKSDNSSIALVSGGLVTAVGVGNTTITSIASGDSTKKASAKITVVGDNQSTPVSVPTTSPTIQPSPVDNKTK